MINHPGQQVDRAVVRFPDLTTTQLDSCPVDQSILGLIVAVLAYVTPADQALSPYDVSHWMSTRRYVMVNQMT